VLLGGLYIDVCAGKPYGASVVTEIVPHEDVDTLYHCAIRGFAFPVYSRYTPIDTAGWSTFASQQIHI